MKDLKGWMAFAAIAVFFLLVTWVAGVAQTHLMREVLK